MRLRDWYLCHDCRAPVGALSPFNRLYSGEHLRLVGHLGKALRCE